MDQIVHQSVILRCDAQRAFEMFTVNTLLESWLTELAEVEAEVGGKYELFWQPHNRIDDSTIGCKITAIEAPKFLAFEWKSPKQFKSFANDADPLTHVVVFFLPLVEYTEVHIMHTGWRSNAEWEAARQWQEKAWQRALQVLSNKVNG